MNVGKFIRVHDVPQIGTQIVSVPGLPVEAEIMTVPQLPSERHAKLREWEQQALEDAPVIVPEHVPEKEGV